MKSSNMTTNSQEQPHYHEGKVWEIFPCYVSCDGRGNIGDPEMRDSWLNGWIFEAFNWVIFTFLIYVCGINEPAFKVYINEKPCFENS